jgi:hypothetical protein
VALRTDQVREAIVRLGMTHAEFATFCGGSSARTVRQWLDGSRRLRGPAEIIVRLTLGVDLRSPDKAMRDRIMAVAREVGKRKGL